MNMLLRNATTEKGAVLDMCLLVRVSLLASTGINTNSNVVQNGTIFKLQRYAIIIE